MATKRFPITEVLYCIALAKGRRGPVTDRNELTKLHKFLTGDTAFDLERSIINSVACGLIIEKQHEALGSVVSSLPLFENGNDAFPSEAAESKWLAPLKQRFGSQIEVASVDSPLLKRFLADARGITYSNFAAADIDLSQDPGEWP